MEYLLIAMVTIFSCMVSSPVNALNSEFEKPGDSYGNESWKNPFLTRTIIPMHYDLFLFPNFYFGESGFGGNVTIHFKVSNATNTIILHKKKLSITSTTVSGCSGQNVTVARAFEYGENDYWVVQTTTPLPRSSCLASLNLTFEGSLEKFGEENSDPPFGFYKSTYVNDKTAKQSWLVATDFQPSNSRFAFPNFDEPQFKVLLTVKLRHWRNFTALSNMKKLSHVNVDNSWRETTFKQSLKMSSYMACFVISDFVSRRNTLIGGKMHRVWARPDRIDKVDYALNITPVIERYLYQELQLPYRLEKLDQVASPELALTSAMENWGLFIYKDSIFLVDVQKDGDATRRTVLSNIAHEMSHNYFGNAVTCRFWNHIWLNEGLTTFYEVRTVTAIEPSFGYIEQHFAVNLEEAMYQDATTTAQPLVPVLSSPHVEHTFFDVVRYNKGAAILRMVENFLGADTFRRGIRFYLRVYENQTVVTDHLWAAIERKRGTSSNLKNVMRTWIYDAGFPVITVKLLPGNQINATQKRFLIDPLAVSDKEYKWYVPLSYRTKRRSIGLVWMNNTDVVFNVTLNSNDDWIQFNYDMSGYYRVNYDTILWNRIMKQLRENHKVFSVVSRSKLLSDALNLAKAEQLGYDTFLNLTRYASQERGYGPWLHIYSSFGDINRMISGTANFSHFQRYFLLLTSSFMDQLQVTDEGSLIEKLIRPKIMSLACYAGHSGCVENATRLFQAWIQNETLNAMPVNFRREVYCIGIANSLLESDWDTVFERFTMMNPCDHKKELRKALSCSRNFTILERLLEYCINGTITDLYDSSAIIFDIGSNPASEDCVWKWLKLDKTGNNEMHQYIFSKLMLESTVQNCMTRDRRKEVLDFLGDGTSVEEKERLRTIMDKNIRWMDKNFATLVSWLERNVPNQSG